MRLDASLGFETPLVRVPEIARAIEAAGIDALWTAETSHDPFLPLALAAEHTERVELGTAIAVAFARSPLVTAATAWDLARLSGGRLLLGLGTQVRAHIERRFGMPWSGRPAAQMREYVAVLRAAWDAWQRGTAPSFRGEFYRFTLMSPVFDPGPIDDPAIPIYLAAVGPRMHRLAGEIADGVIVHPLHSRAYLADLVLPALHEGARAAGRATAAVTVAASVIVATNEEEIAEARRTVGFYASTPTYRPLMEHHGWGSIADALAGHARRSRWDALAGEVTGAMLDAFTIQAPPAELRASLERHADGLIDRVAPYQAFGGRAWRGLVA